MFGIVLIKVPGRHCREVRLPNRPLDDFLRARNGRLSCREWSFDQARIGFGPHEQHCNGDLVGHWRDSVLVGRLGPGSVSVIMKLGNKVAQAFIVQCCQRRVNSGCPEKIAGGPRVERVRVMAALSHSLGLKHDVIPERTEAAD